jgi:RNA-splicing ligase RtcB
MAELGVTLLSSDPKTVAEEVAVAYKDIEAVMADLATFVRPVRRLTPLGVVKGWPYRSSIGRPPSGSAAR